MKLRTINQVEDFLATVNSCKGDVWLESQEGDKFNLKSKLSQFIAMGALLSIHGNELELFCSEPSDESKFFRYFADHPGTL